MYEHPTKSLPLTLRFEVPVGLPNLGENWSRQCSFEGISARVSMRQQKTPTEYQSRFGGMSLQGTGHAYHERDRFGVYAYTEVQVHMNVAANDLFDREILAAMPLSQFPGMPRDSRVLPHLSEFAREFASSLFNSVVDAHTLTFSSYWIPHITPEDIFHMRLVENTPAGGVVRATASGIPGHAWCFGLRENYPSKDISGLDTAFKLLPLRLWEETFLTAIRDATIGRAASAAMHLCLGFEMYVGAILAANNRSPSPDKPRQPALMELCTHPNYLSGLIGGSLDGPARQPVRESFVRIAALRNAVMHRGTARYTASCGEVPVTGDGADFDAHVAYTNGLICHIEKCIVDGGFVGARREGVPWGAA